MTTGVGTTGGTTGAGAGAGDFFALRPPFPCRLTCTSHYLRLSSSALQWLLDWPDKLWTAVFTNALPRSHRWLWSQRPSWGAPKALTTYLEESFPSCAPHDPLSHLFGVQADILQLLHLTFNGPALRELSSWARHNNCLLTEQHIGHWVAANPNQPPHSSKVTPLELEPVAPPPSTYSPGPQPNPHLATLPPASTAPSSSGRPPYSTTQVIERLHADPRPSSSKGAHPQPKHTKEHRSQPNPPRDSRRSHHTRTELGPSTRDTQGPKDPKDPKGAKRRKRSRDSRERRRSSSDKHQPERDPRNISGGKRQSSLSPPRQQVPNRPRATSHSPSPSATSRGTSSHNWRRQQPQQHQQQQIPLPPPLNTLLAGSVGQAEQEEQLDYGASPTNSQRQPLTQLPPRASTALDQGTSLLPHTDAPAPVQHTLPLTDSPIHHVSTLASPPGATATPLVSLPATLPASAPVQTGPAGLPQTQSLSALAPQTTASPPALFGAPALPVTLPQQLAGAGQFSFPFHAQPFTYTPSTPLFHPTPASVPDLHSHQIIVRITSHRPIHSAGLSHV
ncbi:hypothetical protein DUNSADRAFT_1557 [Dunaliella salina]|uniref:Uncharacterized protein n=1 Tax=Dunaliella salina TaxID=3046 RepID=A0ABQ7FXA0_DUNSA|nr:hypothetical protein DUNSADRAFT_1557 [Dunaliella salina]|eukprot:KAF5826983.1 hypothetical protein DUNSADRAFT_1557 [Dunaliella salina]